MPREPRTYYTYIMSSKSGTLYTGVSNSIYRRVMQHRAKNTPCFTARYDVTRFVYYESFSYVLSAIRREKQIKGWTRKRKIALIESVNPKWQDLSADWGKLLPTRPWQVWDPLAELRLKEQAARNPSGPKGGPEE